MDTILIAAGESWMLRWKKGRERVRQRESKKEKESERERKKKNLPKKNCSCLCLTNRTNFIVTEGGGWEGGEAGFTSMNLPSENMCVTYC